MNRRSIDIPAKWKIDVRAKNVTVNPENTHIGSVASLVVIFSDVIDVDGNDVGDKYGVKTAAKGSDETNV